MMEGEGTKLRWRESGGNYDGGRGDKIKMEGEGMKRRKMERGRD